MGNKILTILVTMLLCVSLAACGQKAPEPSTNEEADDATITEQADVADEGEGNYRHQIGNCTFYTEHDLDQWINGDEFDFYGMMDYFGWTERHESLPEDQFFVALWPNDGSHGNVMIKLDGLSTRFDFDAFGGSFSGGAIFTAQYVQKSDRELMVGDYTVPYSVCELLLYVLENFDFNSCDEVVYSLISMSGDLDGYFDITAKFN